MAAQLAAADDELFARGDHGSLSPPPPPQQQQLQQLPQQRADRDEGNLPFIEHCGGRSSGPRARGVWRAHRSPTNSFLSPPAHPRSPSRHRRQCKLACRPCTLWLRPAAPTFVDPRHIVHTSSRHRCAGRLSPTQSAGDWRPWRPPSGALPMGRRSCRPRSKQSPGRRTRRSRSASRRSRPRSARWPAMSP